VRASREWPPSARNAAAGFRSPFARGEGDLALLKAFKAAILNPKIAGI